MAVSGEVVETMNAGGYTYVSVKQEGGQNVWAAAPQTTVVVGDNIRFDGGAPMPGFHSKTLDRTFEQIFFVKGLHQADASAAKAPVAAAPTTAVANQDSMGDDIGAARVKAGEIAKASGGQLVADLFSKKGELSGQKIAVRGKVVKFSANIMGKNWLHLQDGSGDAAANTHDLTVTTQDNVAVGDTVMVRGSLATDVDLGAGYSYPVIVQEAQVTRE